MAWSWYYYEPTETKNKHVTYERKCPPNNSVTETWTTVIIKNDGAEIKFSEYTFYDNDPDGVREAYGCTYDSEYSFTVDLSKNDVQKLFVYTLNNNGTITDSIDIDSARAIYIFTSPQSISDELLLRVTEEVEKAEHYANAVENIINEKILCGNRAVSYLSVFKNR